MNNRELFAYLLEHAEYAGEEFEIIQSVIQRMWLGIKADQDLQADLDNLQFHTQNAINELMWLLTKIEGVKKDVSN